ncbi:MAG: hypothetical protein IIW03_02895, partial [Clostridia bacterium]|nr:hypothetical protein [Clostridia bacterium]
MSKKETLKQTDETAVNKNDEINEQNEFEDIDSIPDDVDILSAEPPVLDLDFDEPSMDELALEELEAENLDDDMSNIDPISLDDPVKVYLKDI